MPRTPRQRARATYRPVLDAIRQAAIAVDAATVGPTENGEVAPEHDSISATQDLLAAIDAVVRIANWPEEVAEDGRYLRNAAARAREALVEDDGTDSLQAVRTLRVVERAFASRDSFTPPSVEHDRRQFGRFRDDIQRLALQIEREPGHGSAVEQAQLAVDWIARIKTWPLSLEEDARALRVAANSLALATLRHADEPTVSARARELGGIAKSIGLSARQTTLEVASPSILDRLEGGGPREEESVDWEGLTGLAPDALAGVREALRSGAFRPVEGPPIAEASATSRERRAIRAAQALPAVPETIETVDQLFPVLRGLGSRRMLRLLNGEERWWLNAVRSAMVDADDLAASVVMPEWQRFREALDDRLDRSVHVAPSQETLLRAAMSLSSAVKSAGVERLVDAETAARRLSGITRFAFTRSEPRRHWVVVAADGPRTGAEVVAMRARRRRRGLPALPRTRPNPSHAGRIAADGSTGFYKQFPPVVDVDYPLDLDGGVRLNRFPQVRDPEGLRSVLDSATVIAVFPNERRSAWAQRTLEALLPPGIIQKYGVGDQHFKDVFATFWVEVADLARGGRGERLPDVSNALAGEVERLTSTSLLRPGVLDITSAKAELGL